MTKKASKPLSPIDQAKLERGIKRLNSLTRYHSMFVCLQVNKGNEILKAYQRDARIALAADHAYTRMMLKYLERR